MELIRTRRRLKLAQKGHSLLKRKCDALVLEFFKLMKEVEGLRKQLATKLTDADNSLLAAESVLGELEVDRALSSVAGTAAYGISYRNVMDVKLPTFTDVKAPTEWFGYHVESIRLDEAVAGYREAFPLLLKLAESELALRKISEKIKSTRRRVNSLEYNVIPWLEESRDSISFKLAEVERDNFIRLKKVKERLQ